MLTLAEIFAFIRISLENESLKEYHTQCVENLKELNKRSNIISFFIIIIFALFSFSSFVTEFSVAGFKISKAIVTITSPLILSYFLLEWCLIARRRRELMKIMKHIGITLYEIPAVAADYDFRHFSLLSRNIMPFSFMIEFINIDISSERRHKFFRFILLIIFVVIISYVIIGFWESIESLQNIEKIKPLEYKILASVILCNLLTLICLILIIAFYKNEFKLKKEISALDIEYLQNEANNQSSPDLNNQ